MPDTRIDLGTACTPSGIATDRATAPCSTLVCVLTSLNVRKYVLMYCCLNILKKECFSNTYFLEVNYSKLSYASQKHLRTKVTPDFHLTYSKNVGNLGSESK